MPAWRENEDAYSFHKSVLLLAPRYREQVFTRCLDTHHDLGFLSVPGPAALHTLTPLETNQTRLLN